ncbi:C4-type zinc ribbon domain-containing protein [Brevibacillus fluminis]|uniref:C4-type zinc ribbon domain-containing protein n=1 Tax=Brevibacillus fluminis TaxID=511487 RepID=UPI003F89FCD4
MAPVKQLWEWHVKREALAAARAAHAQWEKKQRELAQSVALCEQKAAEIENPATPDAEIAKLLAEQELWLARKALAQFDGEQEAQLLKLLQRVQELEFDLAVMGQSLPEEWVAEYYRLAKSKQNPIVEVKGEACTGCFRALSLHNRNEWRRGKGLVHCDECGRILV